MNWFTKRMTPSMAVSCIALLVSLGGIGLAATKLPANSVGTKQLVASSVTSPKVKDGSLRRSDFAQGQLPAGPAGPKGDKGDKGEKGDVGPSDGYVDINKGPVTFAGMTDARIATLRLPTKGVYVLWSKAWLARPTAGQPTEFYCSLKANGQSDRSSGATPTKLDQTLVNGLAVEIDEAATANLFCTGSGPGTAYDAVITAVKVGTLTKSTG